MLLFDVLESYFTPFISKKYCIYFNILSIIFGLLFFFFTFVGAIFIVINFNKIKFASPFVLNWLLFIANSFVAYFVNRLLYSMCLKSMA